MTQHNPTSDALFFFAEQPAAFALYEAFADRVLTLFPEASARVQKTQITFSGRRVFACVSCLRVRRKAELPDPWIVVTLGLPCPLASPRVAAKTEPYPGRWTNHIVVGSVEEIDDELLAWVRQAWDFSARK